MLFAQPQAGSAAFPGTDVFLPSVGSAQGLAPWFTTVWVHNPGPEVATVRVYLLRRQANPEPPVYQDVIEAGQTRRYEDAVHTLFGESKFGALRVVSDRSIVVSSRVYTQRRGKAERDSYGQFLAGIPASLAIGLWQRTQLIGARQEARKRENALFRFNVGVVETSGRPAAVKLQFVDPAGQPLAAPVVWRLGAWEQAKWGSDDRQLHHPRQRRNDQARDCH